MKTKCKVIANILDNEAIKTASYLAYPTITKYTNTANLKQYDKEYPESVALSDLNNFILNGTADISSNDFTAGFWAMGQSTADTYTRAYTSNILASFAKPHTSLGITLHFYRTYPRSVEIAWYSTNYPDTANKITSKVFYPDSLDYFCKEQVENYKYVTIALKGTQYPKQTHIVKSVEYGQRVIWEGEDIQKGTLIEEVDVTCATIPINTVDLTVIDEKRDFDIQNENGLWKSLQTGQMFVMSEFINNKEVALGTFYLNKWDSKDNSISLSLTDILGLLDKSRYCDGGIIQNLSARAIINDIFTVAGLADMYELDADLGSVVLNGYIPIMTCREALQQVAFAIGATVDCSRSSKVKIYTPDKNIDSYILKDRKFSNATVATLDEYVSGVTITCAKYTLGEEKNEVYNGYLTAGTHRIEFTEPHRFYEATGCEIDDDQDNYIVITVPTNGNVVINASGYKRDEFTITSNVEVLEVGQKPKVKSYSNVCLYNSQIMPVVAEQLLKYHSLRQKVTTDFICDIEKAGEWVAIEDTITNDKFAVTRINKQSIDLTGGFLSSAECRGYSIILTSDYYMGDELLMGGIEII